MLDDHPTMEKKPNGRPVQPPPKGGITENKKDAVNKPFGKYSKRRETGAYNNPKNHVVRKTNLPKAGNYPDKRPRPRNRGEVCGKADSKVAELDDPEIGFVFASSSKKQNLNHLLNFHYTPRFTAESGSNGSGTRGRNYPMHWLGNHKHKYNKEQFLQASCQFIVKENNDYTPYLVDPDLLVDWNAIEQIRTQSAGLASCPICLDYPVAAKMTRCGHIYCWSCILHYLALSDKTWRKCPICYEAVHKKDLKSVITLAYQPYNVGDEICLKLMKRERGSLLPVPVEQSDGRSVTDFLYLNETQIDTIYSKLLLAKPEDAMAIIEKERTELLKSLKENEGCTEVCFIEQALELLKEREEFLKNSVSEATTNPNADACTPSANPPSAHEDECGAAVDENELAEDLSSLSLGAEDDNSRKRCESISSEGCAVSEDDQKSFPYEELEISNSSAAKPFYFYQASDGQHVFLQSLNIKMLQMEYGKLEQSPLVIRGKILEKESGSMTEELRKRLRYLKHLPVTCQFEVVELDLSEYVSHVVMENFEQELRFRAERRLRREREERRREKKISEEVDLKWGRHPPPPKLRIDSHRQFPLCGTESDEALSTNPSSPALSRSQSMSSLSSACTAFESTAAESFPTLSSSLATEHSGPSFAQMLKSGASNKSERPVSKLPKQVESWPTARARGSDTEVNTILYVPEYKLNFSEAFAKAFEQAELERRSEKPKKKKKKQRVL